MDEQRTTLTDEDIITSNRENALRAELADPDDDDAVADTDTDDADADADDADS